MRASSLGSGVLSQLLYTELPYDIAKYAPGYIGPSPLEAIIYTTSSPVKVPLRGAERPVIILVNWYD